jgi:VanZ family protein
MPHLLFCLRIGPMLLVMGLIFFLSHQSGDTLHLPSVPGIDKIGHMAVYGLLAVAVLWFLGSVKQVDPAGAALKTVLFCVIYGLSDEWHQSFIPGRMVGCYDLLADLAGTVLFTAIWLRSNVFRARLKACYATIALKLRRFDGDNRCKESGV